METHLEDLIRMRNELKRKAESLQYQATVELEKVRAFDNLISKLRGESVPSIVPRKVTSSQRIGKDSIGLVELALADHEGTIRELAEFTGLSKEGVRRAIQALVASDKVKGSLLRGKACVYRLSTDHIPE